MLIESTTFADAPQAPSAGPAAPSPSVASPDRATRALQAIDDLAARRRTQELVLALERLGAGLDATLGALDEAVAPRPAPVAAAPARSSWGPISTPVVPITAVVPAPGDPGATGPTARPVPVKSAAAPAAPSAPVAPSAPAPVAKPMRQAPAGLAAHVLDLSV